MTRAAFQPVLQSEGAEVTVALDFEQAVQELARCPFDILLVDMEHSGFDLLRYSRQRAPSPKVILMTEQARVETAVLALREGAADYLIQPIDAHLLRQSVARVRQELRAAQRQREILASLEAGLRQLMEIVPAPASVEAEEASSGTSMQFRVGPILLDMDRHVLEVNQQPIDATPTEIEIFYHLCRHPGRVLSPQELMRMLRGYLLKPAEAAEMVRPHISNLRRRLLAASAEADVIATIRSVGYRLKIWPEAG
jgi:DNA-binding response OmpR family regulator